MFEGRILCRVFLCEDRMKVVAFMLLKLSWGKFYDSTFVIEVWKM